jgi:hypothetical protein
MGFLAESLNVRISDLAITDRGSGYPNKLAANTVIKHPTATAKMQPTQ